MMTARPPSLHAARTSLPISKARATRGISHRGPAAGCWGLCCADQMWLWGQLCALAPDMEPISQLPLPKHKEGSWSHGCRESPALGCRRAVRCELKWPDGVLVGEQCAGEEPEPSHFLCSWPCCGRRWLCHGRGAANRSWTAATRQTQGLLVGTAGQWVSWPVGCWEGPAQPSQSFRWYFAPIVVTTTSRIIDSPCPPAFAPLLPGSPQALEALSWPIFASLQEVSCGAKAGSDQCSSTQLSAEGTAARREVRQEGRRAFVAQPCLVP